MAEENVLIMVPAGTQAAPKPKKPKAPETVDSLKAKIAKLQQKILQQNCEIKVYREALHQTPPPKKKKKKASPKGGSKQLVISAPDLQFLGYPPGTIAVKKRAKPTKVKKA